MAEHRRGYAPTLLLGLLAATAVTVGSSRPWITATAHVDGLPSVTSSVSGAQVAPLAGALAVALLASFGAVIATSGWVRRSIGLGVVLAAAAVVYSAVAPGETVPAVEAALSAKGWPGGGYETHTVWWRWVVLGAGLLCAGAGAVISRSGGQWATMGARYDAPTRSSAGEAPSGQQTPTGQPPSASSLSEAEVWRAIDRGDDPTALP